jgi:hypothetical protein
MGSVMSKSFESPDEQRKPEKTQLDIVDLDGVKAARMTAQPGWTWASCIKPVAGTDSCQAHHVGVAVAGRLRVMADDGAEVEIGAGEAYRIQPGHNAEVLGDDVFVGYEFDSTSAAQYAKGS